MIGYWSGVWILVTRWVPDAEFYCLRLFDVWYLKFDFYLWCWYDIIAHAVSLLIYLPLNVWILAVESGIVVLDFLFYKFFFVFLFLCSRFFICLIVVGCWGCSNLALCGVLALFVVVGLCLHLPWLALSFGFSWDNLYHLFAGWSWALFGTMAGEKIFLLCPGED